MDRIDAYYFAHSSRIDVSEETRIKATSDEASLWVKENETPGGSRFVLSDRLSIDSS